MRTPILRKQTGLREADNSVINALVCFTNVKPQLTNSVLNFRICNTAVRSKCYIGDHVWTDNT